MQGHKTSTDVMRNYKLSYGYF